MLVEELAKFFGNHPECVVTDPLHPDLDVTAAAATGYRVKVQVPGEPEPRSFGLFADDQTTLTGLPLGVLLTVTITAHNEFGDGPAGNSVTITLS